MDNHASKKKAWIIAADMGYGHQRTAYPLRDLSVDRRVINANNYEGISEKDRRFWHTTKSLYEFISRFRSIPIVGVALFLFLDRFQKILGYYPKRDLSKSNFSGKNIFYLIRKGWGSDLVERLAKNPLPLVTTFFTPAFMAEEFNYPGDIYCVICDADISRSWVPLDSKNSRIIYLASCSWSRDRLKLYGIKPENIILTGFPLPKENIGGPDMETVKRDLRYRLLNLDPQGKYRRLYSPLVKSYLGELPKLPDHPLTIMFSIGGAGAQKEIALAVVTSLKDVIKAKKIRVIISVGMREELRAYFVEKTKSWALGEWMQVLSGSDMNEYFAAFNKALRTTDILMTKPSELSFYAGLGIPIIIEPSIGSQEDFNRRWLMHIGAATLQENPKYTHEWIFDLLESGEFAEMAMQGFVEIEKMGAYNIENIIRSKSGSKNRPALINNQQYEKGI